MNPILPLDEQQFRSLVEHAIGGVVFAEPDGAIRYASPAAVELLDTSGHTLNATNILDVIHPEDQPLIRAALQPEATAGAEMIFDSIRIASGDGAWMPVSMSARNLVGHPEVRGVVIIIRETQYQETASDDEPASPRLLIDTLTGLPNRTLLADRMEQALLLATRNKEPVAVLLLNVDRFKDVNDALGHTAGDVVLGMVAQRLHTALRASDTFARLIGDEFVALLRGGDDDAAITVAARIENALEEPFLVGNHRIALSATMGIAFYPEHGRTGEELLQHADVALHLARARGTNFGVYRSEDDEHTARRLALRADLREAIEEDRLTLDYQPKLTLATSEIEEVEALVRWVHPIYGFIPPAQFILMAERWNAIRPLTMWALRTAVNQISEWAKDGPQLGVAVNLSARDLHDRDLPTNIRDILDGADVDPSLLTVEVTESMLMIDPDRARMILNDVRSLGVKISIDDFGTGYSSLSYLSRLPLDELKIDISFVAGMARSEHDRFIVAATIDLGHRLGLTVTAEGVEDQETKALLGSMHCDKVQGYHVTRALPPDAFMSWLKTRRDQSSVSALS